MKRILVSIIIFTASFSGFTQTTKTAYVDVYHILKKSPEYTEASMELEKRAEDWKKKIDEKKEEVKKYKDALSVERPLLTQQLIEEKDEEIELIQKELLTLQNEKFGTEGDYFTQKKNIFKPILDQIHTIANDIAVKKRMDIVLVKSDDNTMVYANKRNDITDLVIKQMERTRTRGKMSKKEIDQLELADRIEESKERQRTKRELLYERQQDIESGKTTEGAEGKTTITANSTSPKSGESEIEKRKRIQQERLAGIKEKQAEAKATQLKKIEDQKAAVKKRQEEQKEALEKRKQDILDKQKNKTNESSNQNESSEPNLTEKQKEMQAIRVQKTKEAQQKRDAAIAERKRDVEQRKKEAEEARKLRLKEIEDRKAEKIKPKN